MPAPPPPVPAPEQEGAPALAACLATNKVTHALALLPLKGEVSVPSP